MLQYSCDKCSIGNVYKLVRVRVANRRAIRQRHCLTAATSETILALQLSLRKPTAKFCRKARLRTLPLRSLRERVSAWVWDTLLEGSLLRDRFALSHEFFCNQTQNTMICQPGSGRSGSCCSAAFCTRHALTIHLTVATPILFHIGNIMK